MLLLHCIIESILQLYVLGNEMGYGSVDAAIGNNLKSKGNILCPNLNRKMGEKFI
jgi:hypothetical protein